MAAVPALSPAKESRPGTRSQASRCERLAAILRPPGVIDAIRSHLSLCLIYKAVGIADGSLWSKLLPDEFDILGVLLKDGFIAMGDGHDGSSFWLRVLCPTIPAGVGTPAFPVCS